MRKISLILLSLTLAIGNIASTPIVPDQPNFETLSTGGAHIEDAAMGYQLDIPPNWYVIVPPSTEDEIAAFNSALDEHYSDSDCEVELSSDDLQNRNEMRVLFVSLAVDRICSGFPPTGMVLAAQGDMYIKIPMHLIMERLQESNLPGLISASTLETDSGIVVGVIEARPVEAEHAEISWEGVFNFVVFTTRRGLILIVIFSPLDQHMYIEPDIKEIISSIEYYSPGN